MLSKKAIAFLALTFVISWGVTLAGVALGWNTTPTGAYGALLAMMFGPAVAAVVCAFAFDRGHVREALGLKWTPNLWWIGAYLAGVALCVSSIAFTILLSPNHFTDPTETAISVAAAQAGPQAVAQMRAMPMLPLLIIAQTFLFGPLLNAVVLTFTEELGWRGYLYGVWRPQGFWRTSLVTGAIWGLWHAPAIYFYGLNYPENREIGIVLFVLYCTLLAPVVTLVRERGGSVIAAGIMHGTINAVAGYAALAVGAPSFPWSGVVGIGGFLAVVALCALVIIARGRPAPVPEAV